MLIRMKGLEMENNLMRSWRDDSVGESVCCKTMSTRVGSTAPKQKLGSSAALLTPRDGD